MPWPSEHPAGGAEASLINAVLSGEQSDEALLRGLRPYLGECCRSWLARVGAPARQARALEKEVLRLALRAQLPGKRPRTLLSWFSWYRERSAVYLAHRGGPLPAA